MPNPNEKLTAPSGAGREPRIYASDLLPRMQQILRTLSGLDAEYNLRVHDLECSATDDDLKEQVTRKLKAIHRQQREPYVRQLEELQKQQQRLCLGG